MKATPFHLAWCLLSGAFLVAAEKRPQYHHLPPLREQAAIQDAWRDERVAAIPALLEKHGVDAWLINQKEYAEDTAFWSLKSAKQFSARRRTISIFFSKSLETNCSAHNWIDITPQVWTDLRDVLASCRPSSIVVNIDSQVAFASGLHTGEYSNIVNFLGPRWAEALVNKPIVAVEYIATMPKSRLVWYRKFMETAWAMISEAFSEAVITPGKTTTEDVEWWLRDKIQAMNYTTWFHPDVNILRPDVEQIGPRPPHDEPIAYGDLLHVDFGVTAMGLNTDTQHMAYVLPPGTSEEDIPQGYKDGLKAGNSIQDIVRANMIPGLSGNTILKNALDDMRSSDISGKVYSHPIGDWGHSAGTLTGMFDLQDGVPVLGDLPLFEDMYYSVELYAESFVPELNKSMNFFLEEDVYWDETTQAFEWVYGRQEKFHLIRSSDETPWLRVQS